jgi:hypothetical protein
MRPVNRTSNEQDVSPPFGKDGLAHSRLFSPFSILASQFFFCDVATPTPENRRCSAGRLSSRGAHEPFGGRKESVTLPADPEYPLKRIPSFFNATMQV